MNILSTKKSEFSKSILLSPSPSQNLRASTQKNNSSMSYIDLLYPFRSYKSSIKRTYHAKTFLHYPLVDCFYSDLGPAIVCWSHIPLKDFWTLWDFQKVRAWWMKGSHILKKSQGKELSSHILWCTDHFDHLSMGKLWSSLNINFSNIKVLPCSFLLLKRGSPYSSVQEIAWKKTEEIRVLNLGLWVCFLIFLKKGVILHNHSPSFPYLSLLALLKIVMFLNLELVCNAIDDDGYFFI